ncbi:glutamine-hydrolyzing carbamoyl-phosphate synthase small subunit [Massilia sp. YIM B04103]|uniref:glutamine-hydrolyzing carbamoyl-phosphate synthase small subunit n=1 Tax=Massilia sp. YIM B04103 TaxID=2963106 RepID=UPI00210EC795|nr:glutamine-hydrolyzing carbamoyl-phosphate synthase small subunit [Massilia sp. YIM B04103]
MKHPLTHRSANADHAYLALADGTVFRGVAIGAAGQTSGEAVFNTAMTGYQEILSDPSYSRQIVTLTYPHIGNTGVNHEDGESARIHAAGLVVKDVPALASNFRSGQSLQDWLCAQNVVAIAGIDTRKLTRILRDGGAQSSAIVAGGTEQEALRLARAFPGLNGMDLACTVSTEQAYEWRETEWRLGAGFGVQRAPRYHVVAFDFGVKQNILRMLAQRGCRVTVLPARAGADAALALKPDGVFLSNGPGDPQPCTYAIEAARQLIDIGIPTFGICLGHQIMALASGARTLKMKFGHHGANHPVQDITNGRVMITSQNHGFAVDPESLPRNCRATHISLFDGSLQGFMRIDRPAFCFQGHPEASPGPHDLAPLFDRFIHLMEEQRNA